MARLNHKIGNLQTSTPGENTKRKEKGKNRRDTQKRKTEETAEEKYRSSGLKESSPTSETLNTIIWKTLNGIFYIE
jgi:hypothetical protein